MSFLSRLLTNKTKRIEFEEGDIFYLLSQGKYQTHKLLRFDREGNIFHTLYYEELNSLPTIESLKSLNISIYHAPVDANAFSDAVVLSKQPVTSGELIGYHEFLRQTHPMEFIVNTATGYYLKGNTLAEQRNYQLSIDEYSKAIDLIPQFFEAIDNRAFNKMDTARWQDAIDDFLLSLSVKPGSITALFSIGECYLRLNDGLKAKEQFEKVIEIAPDHKPSHDFLKTAIEMINTPR